MKFVALFWKQKVLHAPGCFTLVTLSFNHFFLSLNTQQVARKDSWDIPCVCVFFSYTSEWHITKFDIDYNNNNIQPHLLISLHHSRKKYNLQALSRGIYKKFDSFISFYENFLFYTSILTSSLSPLSSFSFLIFH